MGALDKIKGLLGQHSDQAKSAVDKVGDAIDQKTGGKYADQVDKGQAQADAFIDENKEGA
jgi:hypothetical protein